MLKKLGVVQIHPDTPHGFGRSLYYINTVLFSAITAAGPRGNTLGQEEGERDRARVAARWTDASLMIDASRAPCCENGTATAPRSHHVLLAQSKQKRSTERHDKCSVLVYLARGDDRDETLR